MKLLLSFNSSLVTHISCRENHFVSFDLLEDCIATSLEGWNSYQHAEGQDAQSPPDTM